MMVGPGLLVANNKSTDDDKIALGPTGLGLFCILEKIIAIITKGCLFNDYRFRWYEQV